MEKVGLVDIDSHNFPNLPLMKISAYHKNRGDSVVWATGFERYDILYMSKVFTFTPDDDTIYQTDETVKGGTGYDLENKLPDEVEHIYPDYTLYPQYDEAYGFLTRGCPRNCDFCIVGQKEGLCSKQVADLSEFWRGQNTIKLLDPNLLACADREKILQSLSRAKLGGDSRAWVDFTQGLDIRLTDKYIAKMLKDIRIKMIHFAWDNPDEDLTGKFVRFKQYTALDERKLRVYVLTNFNSTHEQDLYRIYKLREMGFDPYVMIYDKDKFVECDKNEKPIKLKSINILLKKYAIEQIKHFEKCWSLQGWVNNKLIWRSCERFEDYNPKLG